MNRDTAEGLLLLVNTPGIYEGLQAYVVWRQEMIQKDISSAQDTRALGSLQGRQKELDYLRTLRAAVNSYSKGQPS
jgi:hypothetical protein